MIIIRSNILYYAILYSRINISNRSHNCTLNLSTSVLLNTNKEVKRKFYQVKKKVQYIYINYGS